MKKYTLFSEPGKVNIFAGAYRRIMWYVVWLLRKSKHYLYASGRRILDKTHRHPYLERKRQERATKTAYADIYKLDASTNTQDKQDLLIIVRDGNTYPKSSAFIRLIAPLSKPLISERYNISIFDQNITPVDIPQESICIMQRTVFDTKQEAAAILSAIKSTDSTLIVDNDDAFSLLDSSHSEHSHLGEKSDALELLAENADELWVSTPTMASINPNYLPKTTVMLNTLDDRLWHIKHLTQPTDKPIKMVYMGTATHDADLKMITPVLDSIHAKFPGSFELSIIGISASSIPEKPWLNRLYQPRGHAFYPKFVSWFLNQGPFDIGLCPLVSSPFNDAKSDIKCLDYIAAGIHPIASNVPAYQTPEIQEFITTVNNTIEDWEIVLTDAIKNPEQFRLSSVNKNQAALEYLKTRRSNQFIAETMLSRLSLYPTGHTSK